MNGWIPWKQWLKPNWYPLMRWWWMESLWSFHGDANELQLLRIAILCQFTAGVALVGVVKERDELSSALMNMFPQHESWYWLSWISGIYASFSKNKCFVAPYKALQPLHSKVLAWQVATIFCHWSGVGSTPVGLWATASWLRMLRSSRHPQSSPNLFELCLNHGQTDWICMDFFSFPFCGWMGLALNKKNLQFTVQQEGTSGLSGDMVTVDASRQHGAGCTRLPRHRKCDSETWQMEYQREHKLVMLSCV